MAPSARVRANPTANRTTCPFSSDATEEDLEFAQQLGVKYVSIPSGGEKATADNFLRMKQRVEAAGRKAHAFSADQAGKVFTYTREETDPVTKQKSKARDVIRIESNDKYVMEMYKDEGGKEIKMMEIVSTRKK